MLRQSTSGLFARGSNATRTMMTLSTSSGHQLTDLTASSMPEQVCVYWYIGPNGLKQGTIDFYREPLSRHIKLGATPCLVDLTSWGALKGKCKLSDYHESGLSLRSDEMITVLACNYFSALQEIQTDTDICKFLQEIASREELQNVSDTFQDSGKTLSELFKDQCPALSPIASLDCAKTYSVIQYIEFLFYIEMILKQRPNTENIRFILPNDEAKYYLPTLQQDLTQFLALRGCSPEKLNIHIECFEYGSERLHRPYNIPSKTIPRKKVLTTESVLDPAIIDTKYLRKI